MSWVTFVWALVIGASLTMALPHLFIGLKDLTWESFLFAISAFCVAGVAFGELAIMHAATPHEIGQNLQWTHIPLFFLTIAIVGFVYTYFGTGRLWLLVAIGIVRGALLVINFAFPPNLNFREITGLQRFGFLGETVSMPSGVVGPATSLGQVSSLLILIFVIDASILLWRRGRPDGRRRALVVGGSITVFILVGAVLAALTHAKVVQLPYLVSFPFLGVIMAMCLELNYDVLRAAHTVRQLRASEAALRESNTQMSLAVSAAKLGIWVWNIKRDEIWITNEGKALFGFPESEPVEHEGFVKAVHEEDRPAMEAIIRTAFAVGGEYENEYRIVRPNGEVRWMAGYGRVELDAHGQPDFMRGATRDITERKQAAAELRERRGELAHLSRVTMLGELSGSLAHELNQPLTAILSNAQAAQRNLEVESPDLAEVREILADIVEEDERAGEVIRRLRLLFRKGEVQQQALDANELVLEVCKLMRSDLANHGVTVKTALGSALAPICGDRVQLQQVLLNLVMNACDAMAENQPGHRQLTLRTVAADDPARLRIEVSDMGRGLPAGDPEKVFERYYTTKPHGLGLGLSVCRTITGAHNGTLEARNNPEGGATFVCTLGDPSA